MKTCHICVECSRVHDDRAADALDWVVTTHQGTPLCVYCPRHIPRAYQFCTKHGLPQTTTPLGPYDLCPECCIDRYLPNTPSEQREWVLADIESIARSNYARWGVLDRYDLDAVFARARAVLINAEYDHDSF